MSTGDILPGYYSDLGRVTGRSLHKLRKSVEERDAALKKREAAKTLRKPTVEVSPIEPEKLDEARIQKMLALTGHTLKSLDTSRSISTTAPDDKVSLLSFKNASSMGSPSPRSGISHRGHNDSMHSTTSLDFKSSSSFTSLGRDDGAYCEMARVQSRRCILPAKFDLKPPLGHYFVNESSVLGRQPHCNFGEKPKHLPIRPKEIDTGAEVGDDYSSFENPFHRSSGLEQMMLATDRPNLATISGIRMTFAPEHMTEWAKLDKHSSLVERQPEWDFQKHSKGHTTDQLDTCKFFEPGKYDVHYDAIGSAVKSGVHFKRAWNRIQSEGSLGFNAPKALLKPSTALIPDRSRFRGCAQTVQSKLLVHDFEKDLDRPPLTAASQVYYDEDDPKASEKVWEHEMTFDASIADHALVRRLDRSVSMSSCLPRSRACRGNRMVETDAGVLHSLGIGYTDHSVELSSIEAAKESPSRPRADLGCRFDLVKGREHVKKQQVFSPLRQPRDHAAPDFSRRARSGFISRTYIDRPAVLSETRTHEALPTWESECRNEVETETDL